MEEANRYLMTQTHEMAQHREDAAENSLSRGDHALQVSPRAGPGSQPRSLGIQNDSFPGSQGRKSCCFPLGRAAWACWLWGLAHYSLEWAGFRGATP